MRCAPCIIVYQHFKPRSSYKLVMLVSIVIYHHRTQLLGALLLVLFAYSQPSPLSYLLPVLRYAQHVCTHQLVIVGHHQAVSQLLIITVRSILLASILVGTSASVIQLISTKSNLFSIYRHLTASLSHYREHKNITKTMIGRVLHGSTAQQDLVVVLYGCWCVAQECASTLKNQK